MLTWHEAINLPPPLITSFTEDGLSVSLPETDPVVFRVHWVASLSENEARQIASTKPDRGLVVFKRSSPAAREVLRAADVSFAGEDGRLFLRVPGVFVVHDDRSHPASSVQAEALVPDSDRVRNPFAKRSSRVPRWLLLHHEQVFSPSTVASQVDLDASAVSRVLMALEEDAFLREVDANVGSWRRALRLARPTALLEAWLRQWERRRVRQRVWDIGARNAAEALEMLTAVSDREGWAVGGVAGAAFLRRAVEPADVLVWVQPDAVTKLTNALQPEPARGGVGLIRVAVAPDPWTLGLRRQIDELPIADPVQLWLDCASAGERALEAADAVARKMAWK